MAILAINLSSIVNTDSHPYQVCGGTFTNETGIITSPLHPNEYPKNAECDYLISQQNGTFINLTLEALDIEELPSCSGDFLEIRDGFSLESRAIGKFCGTDVTMSLQSTQNYLRLRLGRAKT